jgi:MFS transporter, FLVCR family, MFS-domain-containing protein 7
MSASILILCGNWLRYVGARLALFPVVLTGQILIGLAQPFVLAAPTRYSDLWFSEKGRTTATAIASLANPFGGAVCEKHVFVIQREWLTFVNSLGKS